ncbi:hypothetical protein [Brevibacillus sp. NRS-1366]|uniref:hypothetical protein n=1 Tax=Brevibacillus sp. NRS-1366 TaxID=3233899 RepID=UPI003D243592
MAEGFFNEDADHYAYVNELVKNMEEKGVEFSLKENEVEDLSDEYVNSHPREYKEKIRNLDKLAWKKELIALAKQQERMSEVQKKIDKDRKKGNLKDQYEVQFSDGTIFKVNFNTSEVDPERAKELTKNLALAELRPHKAGPWNGTTYIDTLTTPDKSGNYSSGTTWEFRQNSNISKVGIAHHFYLNNNNTPGDIMDDAVSTNTSATQGSAAGYGIVEVVEEPVVNAFTYAKGISNYIQSYKPAKATVSQSFSAAYLGLSINAGAKASWKQFSISEVEGPGICYMFAATYK